MMWKGVIIEESLRNKELLNLVKIVNTKKTTLEKEDEKGILRFHRIELEDKDKNKFVKKAKQAIKQGRYIHACRDGRMVIIFKNKSFEFNENEKMEEAKNYGISIGILPQQMQIESLIRNPFG